MNHKRIFRRRVRRGGLSTQDDINILGQTAINDLETYVPVLNQASSIINPIADKLISKLPSKTFADAERDPVDKYLNLFHDDQFIYNKDGTLKYPKNFQVWYMLGQRWLLEHGNPQGSPEYHTYVNNLQKKLGISDKELYANLPYIILDHNH